MPGKHNITPSCNTLCARESVVVTANLKSGKQTTVRRCLVARDRPVFTDLVQSMNQLFGIKASPNSFHYIDSGGQIVSFSSDEELAIAFQLSDRELRICLEELSPLPLSREILKVENPSSNDSSSIISSLESSPSQHSTPTGNFNQQKNMATNSSSSSSSNGSRSGNSTPSLYRSKIVPKLKYQYNLSTSSNSLTFNKEENNGVGRIAAEQGVKNTCKQGNSYNFVDRRDGTKNSTLETLASRTNPGTDSVPSEDASCPPMRSLTVQCCCRAKCINGNKMEQPNAGKFKALVTALRHIIKYISLFVLPGIVKEIF